MAAHLRTPPHPLPSEPDPTARSTPATSVLVAAIAITALLSTVLPTSPTAAWGDEPAGPWDPVSLVVWLAAPGTADMGPTDGPATLTPAVDGRSGGLQLHGAVLDAEGRVTDRADGELSVRLTTQGAGSVLALDGTGDGSVWDGADDVPVTGGRLVPDPPVVLGAGTRGTVTLRAQGAHNGEALVAGELDVQITGHPDPGAAVQVRVVQGEAEQTGAVTLVEVSGLREHPADDPGVRAALGGVRAELFDAGRQVTRGELAALLVRVLQAGGAVASPLEASGGEGPAAMTDVGPGHPFATEIGVVLRTDVMRGFVDGTFRPEDLVPRQQAASFLVRTLVELEVELTSAPDSSFDDLDDAPLLHVGSIAKLVGTGVLEPGGAFRPRDLLRRGEFAEWLMGTIDVLHAGQGTTSGFDPLPGYAAVGEVSDGVARFAIDAPGAAAQAISVLEHGLLVGGRLIPGVAETIGHAVGSDLEDVRPGPGTAPVTVPSRPLDPACLGAPSERFVDVVGVHAPGIDCVGWWQVAQGQSAAEGVGDVYRPDQPVTRAQMATFVARVVAASGGTLPEDPPSPFTDTAGSVHAQAIDQLAALGVVGGVAAGTYDPGGTVTRAQMASFLARTVELRTDAGLPIGPVAFDDLREGATHADNVLRIASAGLTGGVSPGTYDPAGTVTRGQMGTFLARLLALLVVEGAAPGGPEPTLE